jgi:hypothetical protein
LADESRGCLACLAAIEVEADAGCERGLVDASLAAGMPVRQINRRQANPVQLSLDAKVTRGPVSRPVLPRNFGVTFQVTFPSGRIC